MKVESALSRHATPKQLSDWCEAAEAALAQGRYTEAETLYLQALPLAERFFGMDGLETSTVLNNLAVVCKYLARFTEAGQLYQRALAITEKRSGKEHVDAATIWHNLGGLEHAAGNFARGEPFARRAVEIREKALGPDHADVAEDLAALAALLDGQKKYDEAECLYRRALAIFERVYGTEHYEIAININNLGALKQAQGQFDEAESCYLRALALKEKLLGSDHPDVAMTLNNLAVFYKARQRYVEAEPLYRRALAIFETALGAAHPKVVVCLENYGGLLGKLGCADEAQALKARARTIREQLGLICSKDTAPTGTINPQFACFALSARASAIHRLGVFAAERIPAGRKVIEYAGERINNAEARRRGARSHQYMFMLNEDWTIDGGVGGSGAELINHSCTPNLVTRIIKGHILFFSKREIAADEELTVDYKFSPDDSPVRCHCGAPQCRGTINLKPARSAPHSKSQL